MTTLRVAVKTHIREDSIQVDLDPRELAFTENTLYLGDEHTFAMSHVKEVHIKFLDQQKGQATDGAAASTPPSGV